MFLSNPPWNKEDENYPLSLKYTYILLEAIAELKISAYCRINC